MSETVPTSPSPPEKMRPDAALVETVKAQLTARGGQLRTSPLMGYPAPLFNELIERLCDRGHSTAQTLEWAEEECLERELAAPGHSGFYKFAAVVRQEYRMAQLMSTRGQAEGYVKAFTEGDPDAMAVALNQRFTELLTDAMLRTQDLDDVDADRLFALTAAAKSVAQVTFGKQMKDARIAGLQKQIQERDADIALKSQELLIREEKLKAQKKKQAEAVAIAEKAAGKGASGADVVDLVKKAMGLDGGAA